MSAEKATFGGGCFWGMEKFYKKKFGSAIKSIAVGYLGGKAVNPSYEDVCTGRTGHAEVVQLEYNPKELSYRDLLEYFWRIHDPTTLNSQGNDRAVFYHNDEQKKLAEEVKAELEKSGKIKGKIVTEITPASTFYKAEDYHQQYLDKNPGGYCNHRERW